MKPHLRMWRGMWYCGLFHTNPEWWSCAQTPAEAYELWARRRA
jgi:hypothetical protein